MKEKQTIVTKLDKGLCAMHQTSVHSIESFDFRTNTQTSNQLQFHGLYNYCITIINEQMHKITG